MAALKPGCASFRHQAPGAHRYAAGVGDPSMAGTDQGPAGRGGSGWRSGQSIRRAAGGLMTEQSANDMVRDHRNMPSLLVSA